MCIRKTLNPVAMVALSLTIMVLLMWPSSLLSASSKLAFKAAVNYQTDTDPHMVAMGDLNGDGAVDLAVVNMNGENVSILLNRGNGSLASANNYEIGDLPGSVALGDLDNDGSLDLAVTVSGENQIAVLLNQGNGTFQNAVKFSVGDDPSMVAIEDLNQDGDLDLAVANNHSDDVSVLFGNGDGTFNPEVSYAVGNEPKSIAIGDLNGDGDIDVVVANWWDHNVSILLNHGDGTFQAAFNYAVGDRPGAVAIGDLNGDGAPELVATNVHSDTVSVLVNNNDWNSTFQSAVNYPTGDWPNSGAIGDLNGDGIPDIAVTNYYASKVAVLLGNGDGSFQKPIHLGAGLYPVSVVAGDLNGDESLDLAVVNWGDANVSVLLNRAQIVLWQDQLNGSANEEDIATAIAVHGNRVFVVGKIRNLVTGDDFVIRVYHAKRGSLLWQDQVDGDADGPDIANSVAVQGHRVFVGGFIDNHGTGNDSTLRAYNAYTGAVLWENAVENGTVNAIAVEGKRVFAAGTSDISAYHINTGDLLWQKPASPTPASDAIAGKKNRVIVAEGGARKTYFAKTGELLWEHQTGYSTARAVAIAGKRAFMAGWGTYSKKDWYYSLIWAYNTYTGRLLWTAGEEPAAANALAVFKNRVFVAGESDNGGCLRCGEFNVQALHFRTGKMLWANRLRGSDKNGINVAYAVAAQGDRVFAAGESENLHTGIDFAVRAYHARSGKLLWQNQYNGSSDGDDAAKAIAVAGNRVFVVGTVENTTTGHDFAVRAYKAK